MDLLWIALACGAFFVVDYVAVKFAGRQSSGQKNSSTDRLVRSSSLPEDFEKLVASANALGKLFSDSFASVISAQLGGFEHIESLKNWCGESIRRDDDGHAYILCGERRVPVSHMNSVATTLGVKLKLLANEAMRLPALERSSPAPVFMEASNSLTDRAQLMLLSVMKFGFLLEIYNPSITPAQLEELCQAT